MIRLQRYIWACFLFLFMVLPLESEQIRGKVTHILKVGEQYQPVSASIGLHELIGISFPEDEYLKGIIIEIRTPDSVLQFRESFLLSLHDSISPQITTETERYNGRKLHSKAFPRYRRSYIDLHLDTDSDWERSSMNSTVLTPSSVGENPAVLLSIDPVMKGIPSHISTSTFDLTITPVLHEKGALSLVISPGEAAADVDILLDRQKTGLTEGKVFLSTGIHTLDIVSDEYLPYSQSFGIEQAETTRLEIELQPAASYVQFDAPADAIVFFDGQKVEAPNQGPVETSPGEHMVLVRIGDYSVSKKFDFKGGKEYKVSLFFDILINDN